MCLSKYKKISIAISIKFWLWLIGITLLNYVPTTMTTTTATALSQNSVNDTLTKDHKVSVNEGIVELPAKCAAKIEIENEIENRIKSVDSAASDVELERRFQVFEVARKGKSSFATGRSYVCIPLFRVFKLEVRQPLGPNEDIGVTGDHPTLGQWQISKSRALRPQNAARTRWFLRLWVCASQRFYYRYFIYEPDGRGQKQVRVWEGQPTPRMLQSYEIHRKPGLDVFGEAYSSWEVGGMQRERGWLRHEYAIELKFIWRERRHINLVREQEKYLLRLEAVNQQQLIPGVNAALIEVARYAYNRSRLRRPPARGVRYTPGAIIVFRITQPLKTKNTFKLTIADVSAEPRAIGEVYILPIDLRGSRGVLQLPIHSAMNDFQIGHMELPYLIVQPLAESTQINLRASFHHYWPMNWPTVDVGHRGLGASYYGHTDTAHVENTIKSFLAVPRAKGDMVEFDVQLTRDYVPVVWHAFGFYTAQADRVVVDRFDLSYVLIKDLSYEELKASRVFVPHHWSLQEYTHLNVKNVTYAERLFPTLAEVYQSLPKTLGLVIEIKWPQLMESGVMESPQTLNKNQYVDELLEITNKFGCGRPIVFSSFDADICTMWRLKQIAYPIMLMTTGKQKIWDPYMDLRTQSFQQAVNFAEAADILGTATHVSTFLRKPRLVHLGLNMNQAVFIWGNDLRDEALLEEFRELEVSGLIYDQLDVFGPKKWKRDIFFNANELLEIFGKQCISIGNSTTIPGIKPPKPTIWPKM